MQLKFKLEVSFYEKNLRFNIVIRDGNIDLKHGPYCWYFWLNVKCRGWPYRAYIKNSEKCQLLLGFSQWKWLWGRFNHFFCYDHGAKASEEVQRFATHQKEYRKCSLCVIISWIAKIYLSINKSEKWLLKLHKKRAITGSWWVLSIMEVR